MRPDILNRGYRPWIKAMFALFRAFSGHPLPDVARLTFYRPDFYGTTAKRFTHAALRGPSPWSVADRELIAAYVSHLNACAFCVGAHTAIAERAYGDDTKVRAVLTDLESAPIEEGLRATLRMLDTLMRTETVGVEDMRKLLSAGVSRPQIEDALAVCAALDTANRLADSFDFDLPSPAGFAAGAGYLLKRGYR
ncbi:putative peroxidase-related enzyme [Nocardia tenerifensis]|uniref:Putative peroxidase-related enzyme n=1 Tax=Nocardia tenerifensis TaxID=228006 RepID=A0A318K1I5_9NOCA|nr:carboxymuconolactone decarboxylase family protein [Nocardia tenerifensis]PXX61025.1 putative peroxidase-related enzyme [Nocardia tenerifensis]